MDRSASAASKHLPRAGGTALALLSTALNLEVLRCLEEGPRPLQDLMRTLGFPPPSTTRLYLRTLSEIKAIERRPRNEFPTSVDYEITAAGRALLETSELLQGWLNGSPGGEIELGSVAAKSAIKALVDGWASNLVRALAARPLALTELNTLIPRISYPSLERRLTAMRNAGLVLAHRGEGRATPYEVTEWLRRAIAPVSAAMAWERTHAPDRTASVGRLDFEAAFLLAIPLLELPRDLSGKCRLAVEIHNGASPVFAGVLLCVEDGRVTSCGAAAESEAEAWVSGKPLEWLRRMSGGPAGQLEVGGTSRLAHLTVEALGRTQLQPQ
jgi:DNA-binding HxlR family transcriptional regulator